MIAERRCPRKRNPVAQALGMAFPRTWREMTVQPIRTHTYRRFDRRHWLKAERDNLRPFDLWVFETPGGRAALQYFDAWAQVELVRRATADASSMPARDGGKGAIGEGFCLPAVSLKAMAVGKWLASQDEWVTSLIAFIFIDGWEPRRREVAYYLPNPRTEEDIQRILQRVRRWEKLAKVPREKVANAGKEVQALREKAIIVLGGDEPPPVQAQAERTLIVRRWTFDLSLFEHEGLEKTPPRNRPDTLVTVMLGITLHFAAALGLGSTTPKALAAFRELPGHGGD